MTALVIAINVLGLLIIFWLAFLSYRMVIAHKNYRRCLDEFFEYELARLNRFKLAVACLPNDGKMELFLQYKPLNFEDYFIGSNEIYGWRKLITQAIYNPQISDYRVDGDLQLKALLSKKGLTLIE